MGYEQHVAYSSSLRAQLTAAHRSIILAIKEAYWRRPEYRDTVICDLSYRAVLDKAIRSVEEFEVYMKATAA